MSGRLAAAAAPLFAALAACSSAEPGLIEQRLLAMGTWVDVVLELPDDVSGAALLADIEALLRRREIDYYAWADGELARLNAALHRGEAMVVSTELAQLLADARRYAGLSDGHFDPDIAGLVELWGFHSSTVDGEQPDEQAIDAWLASHAGITSLQVDGREVVPTEPGVRIDLGGIAKGRVVDELLALLQASGVTNALVNAGGDVAVIGTRGDRPWRIGIQDPRETGAIAVLEIEGSGAAFTSGDYERFREHDGLRMHHILDPRTGRPAMHTMSVTVLADHGTLADAAATALFVAGPQRWRVVADALGIDAALRIDASGAVEMTPSMLQRITLTGRSAGESRRQAMEALP